MILMLRFEYRALSRDGKLLVGEICANDPETAVQQLRARGMNVQSLEPGTSPIWIQTIDACLAQREEIVRCLEGCCSQSRWLRHDKGIAHLIRRLSDGASANDFVSQRDLAQFLPLVLLFDPNRKEASEFSDWSEAYLRQANKNRFIWRLFSYPVLLPLIYLTILVVMSFTIIPQFRQMFNEFELRLPTATLLLLSISEQISEHPFRTFVVCAAIGGVFAGMVVLLRLLLRRSQDVPILGYFSQSSKAHLLAMSRLTATLAELLRISTPLTDAIQIAGLASGDHYFRQESESASTMLSAGIRPSKVLWIPSCFPSSLVHALQSAPGQQPSVELIQRLSKIYSDRLEQRSRFAGSFVAPAMTIIMAWFISFVVSALMFPLLSLMTSLSS